MKIMLENIVNKTIILLGFKDITNKILNIFQIVYLEIWIIILKNTNNGRRSQSQPKISIDQLQLEYDNLKKEASKYENIKKER